MTRVPLERKVLNENDRLAADLRQGFLRHGTWCVNLISSPGSGKTMLLERTLASFEPGRRRHSNEQRRTAPRASRLDWRPERPPQAERLPHNSRRQFEYHPGRPFPSRGSGAKEVAGRVADHSCLGATPIGPAREGVQHGLMAGGIQLVHDAPFL